MGSNKFGRGLRFGKGNFPVEDGTAGGGNERFLFFSPTGKIPPADDNPRRQIPLPNLNPPPNFSSSPGVTPPDQGEGEQGDLWARSPKLGRDMLDFVNPCGG